MLRLNSRPKSNQVASDLFQVTSNIQLITWSKKNYSLQGQKIQVKYGQHSPVSCAVTSDIRKPWLLAQSWEENEVKTDIHTLYSSIKLGGLQWENPMNRHTFIIFIYFWIELYLSAIAGLVLAEIVFHQALWEPLFNPYGIKACSITSFMNALCWSVCF